MKLLARHVVLVSGPGREECLNQVLNFFERTSLVRYDRIELDEKVQFCACEQDFSAALAAGLARNRDILAGLVQELSAAGFNSRTDLLGLPQGYQSKVLHIVAHFLDGFIGIDTAFYNLVDDSHWLPEPTAELLRSTPERFWLFSLNCYSMSPRESALLHM